MRSFSKILSAINTDIHMRLSADDEMGESYECDDG